MDIGRDQFYVTLLSNASIDLYPDNTRAVFTTYLAHPIDLGTSSEWEVGLCEISYGAPRMNLSNLIHTLTKRWDLFIATSSHRN